MLADPARRTLLSRSARRVCGAVSAYLCHGVVRGRALLATDNEQRLSFGGQPIWEHSVVADTPCPHSMLSPTPIILIADCEIYSRRPLSVLFMTITVK
jgi:hypothetical protein